jgi:hypothetical protein
MSLLPAFLQIASIFFYQIAAIHKEHHKIDSFIVAFSSNVAKVVSL